MNREIRFRCWDESDKTMGEPFDFYEYAYEIDTYFQRPMIFMQFTGLLDKHGNEIYESDIVHYLCASGELHWDMKEEIKWMHGAYRFGNFIPGATMPGCLRDYEKQPWLEVIGNIYENPDLLTKGDS